MCINCKHEESNKCYSTSFRYELLTEFYKWESNPNELDDHECACYVLGLF